MTINANLINATLTEIEKTIAVAADIIETRAVISYLEVQTFVFNQDTQTQQDFLARSGLHTLIHQTLPAPGYW
jgi:hypothetical protein